MVVYDEAPLVVGAESYQDVVVVDDVEVAYQTCV